MLHYKQSNPRLVSLKQPETHFSMRRRRPGFALIVSLVLMGFMMLLVVSISTLLQVEIASTNHSKDEQLARQNAYFGLMTALGELQRVAGPDARITARSDIFLGPDGLTDARLLQPYWLGVWNSKNADGTNFLSQDYKDWNAETPEEKIANAHWVVSGNAGLSQNDPEYWTPLKEVPVETSVMMAGAAEDYDVPEVRVPKVMVDGGKDVGHYAYWVSGDNSKALVNIVNEEAVDSSDIETLNREFQAPNRVGVNVVSGLEDYPVNDVSVTRVLDLSTGLPQWISDDSNDFNTIRRARFHDLTDYSKGLLVDVKDGALKRDLTQAFEINTSFAHHFPEEVAYGTQELSDTMASDPMTPEPFYFVEDPIIVSGSPNWGVLRDYYQQYFRADNMQIEQMNFRRAYRTAPSGAYEPVFTPHWHGSATHTDPYISSSLPYQYTSSESKNKGDNYQATSLATPLIVQLRISHAIELVSTAPNGDVLMAPDHSLPPPPETPLGEVPIEPVMIPTPVPVISFKPVISLYNPYNTIMQSSDFGFVSTLNPKITIDLFLADGTKTVEFNQAELHTSNKQGTLKVSLGDFSAQPGQILHEAFVGSPYAKVESNSGSNSDYVKTIWTSVGGLRFPLNVIDEDHLPDSAKQDGAVNLEDARDGYKQPSWHPKWGISDDEKMWLEMAVQQNASMSIKIEYDKFGLIRSWTNSTAAGQNYHSIVNLWRPFDEDQPETFSTSFPSMTSATNQDSFETLAFSLRTTERMGGETSATESLRNLIDLNVRAIHSNSTWDGGVGVGRYLSLFDAEVLGENQQEPHSYTDEDTGQKRGYWGPSVDTSKGEDSVVLFERPREPLLSLGQLQHANLGRYQFDPTYIVGNSYANIRIPMDQTKVSNFGGESGLTYFDVSYLANERIWDGFFFSTIEIPDTVPEREALAVAMDLPGAQMSDFVLNPRMEFISSGELNSERYKKIVVSDTGDEDFADAIYRPASEMWINGAFNINSTSVEAWKAILSTTQNLRFPQYDPSGSKTIVSEEGTVFSRFSRPYDGKFDLANTYTESEFWKGYRVLNSAEIEDLAEGIVKLVKERGPFLSMASFVNRQLETDERGKKGLLQEALDNPELGSDSSTAVNKIDSNNIAGEEVATFTVATSFLEENLSSTDRTNMGFPGYVLQGDILQHIAPFLTVRSDTFTIRSYGDVVNPITQEVTARVWCEAKVQRTTEPMPVAGQDISEMSEFIQPTSSYGRRFQVVSFRWLETEEI